MKVVSQLIVFVVLLVVGWAAYEKHTAFRELVKDIAQYSGLMADHSQVSATTGANDTIPAKKPATAVTTGERVANIDQSGKAEVKMQNPQGPGPVLKPVNSQILPELDSLRESGTTRQSKASQPQQELPGQQQDTATDYGLAESGPATVSARSEADRVAAIADMQGSLVSGDNPLQTQSGDASDPHPEAKPAANTAELAKAQDKWSKYPQDISGAQEVTEPSGEPVPPAYSAATTPEINTLQRKQNALVGLAAARQAWHSGQSGEAVQQYMRLMREYGNHPDFAGELGNIYFARGEAELAVNAYSEAVVRLLRNGDNPRARKTLHIIHNLNPGRASILQKHFAPLR